MKCLFFVILEKKLKKITMTLKELLQTIALKWGYKLTEYTPNSFAMDVGIKNKEGHIRYQFVYISLEDKEPGFERYFVSSRCGVFTPRIDLYQILLATGWCNSCGLTLTKLKNKEGVEEDVLRFQAAPLVSALTVDAMDDIIYDVARMADYVEDKYFGGDVN